MIPALAITPPWLPVVFIVAFPFFFVAMWCGVCLLTSAIGGWGRLAKKYPATAPPSGTRFPGQTGYVGVSRYRGVLTIHLSPEGLHLDVVKIFRIGHPPLFIPWSEIHNPAVRRNLWGESVVFEVGLPKIAKLLLPKAIFEGTSIAV